MDILFKLLVINDKDDATFELFVTPDASLIDLLHGQQHHSCKRYRHDNPFVFAFARAGRKKKEKNMEAFELSQSSHFFPENNFAK